MSKGRHRKPSRIARIAAPAAGITAAGAFAVMAASGAQAQILPHPVVAAETSALITTTEHSALEGVMVHSGDSLSKIAQETCGNPKMWTGLWNYNHKTLHWGNPDVIEPGQHIIPDCRVEEVWVDTPPVLTSYVQHNSYSAPQSYNAPSGSYGYVNAGNYSGIQSCIVSRESGGNSQVMNSSDHYGLYQFDYGTWVSGGGNPGDFGHASVAEQNQVFQNVYAARGAEPWASSDGC